MRLRIAHDAAAADLRAAGLELRLDEDQRPPAGLRAGEHGGSAAERR